MHPVHLRQLVVVVSRQSLQAKQPVGIFLLFGFLVMCN
jgi:hypothetical protein